MQKLGVRYRCIAKGDLSSSSTTGGCIASSDCRITYPKQLFKQEAVRCGAQSGTFIRMAIVSKRRFKNKL
ncbi:hypothetical protein RR46_04889 [Papilio xuthus]|uniref:Uncharacterized protein n=1 Tax=Papilio xuthus TaxID=66420 RepID=A0A194PVH6_PAPXU|nr:hypothetical protein RR46_04889 [Papilio xuthus]